MVKVVCHTTQSELFKLFVALFPHQTGDQLFSTTFLHQQGQQAQLWHKMTSAFLRRQLHRGSQMGLEGQGEREVRISAELTFIQILHS